MELQGSNTYRTAGMCGEGLEEEREKGGALDHGSLTLSMEGQLTVMRWGRWRVSRQEGRLVFTIVSFSCIASFTRLPHSNFHCIVKCC